MLLSLVNLPLLASLEERSTNEVLGCFLGAEDRDGLEKRFLVDEAARDRFALLWEAMTEPEVECYSTRVRTDFRVRVSGQE